MQNVLKKILLTSGVSKTQLAKDLGLSKSFVLNVINGTKKCSRSMYDKIRTLSYVSNTLKDELDEAFYGNVFGEDNYALVKYFIELLENTESEFVEDSKIYVRKDFLNSIISSNEKCHIINNMNELLEFAVYFAERCVSDDGAFFYTNYNYSQTELDKLLFTVFRDRDYSKKLEYLHLITSNNTLQQETLFAMYNSIKWARILLETKYTRSYYGNSTKLFPNYIITPYGVILFDNSCEKGLVLSQASVIEFYSMNFLEIQKNMNTVCSIVPDEAACLGQSDIFATMSESIVSYGGLACFGPYFDEDILKTISYETPQRDVLLHMLLAHYKAVYYSGHKEYIAEAPYWIFTDDGDVHCVTDRYVEKCSPEDRAKLLEHIIEGNKADDKVMKTRLLDSNKITMPMNICVDCFNTHSVITSLFINEPCMKYTKPYSVVLTVNYSEMYWFRELSENLCTYIEEKNYVLSDDACINSIERMVAKCKGLNN